MTPCLTCGTPCSGPRCPAHTKARRRQLYGRDHDAERRIWAPHVAAGTVRCWRCVAAGEPDEVSLIQPGTMWDLGHRTPPLGRHPEHARCNRAAGARLTL